MGKEGHGRGRMRKPGTNRGEKWKPQSCCYAVGAVIEPYLINLP